MLLEAWHGSERVKLHLLVDTVLGMHVVHYIIEGILYIDEGTLPVCNPYNQSGL